MKAAIMQPYFFPYLGYYQLINAVDIFIVYDDVNYINRSWINRNYLLSADDKFRFTMETIGASQNKLIKDIEVGNNFKKLLLTLHHLYSKAPFFNDVSELLRRVFNYKDHNLANFLCESIIRTCEYMSIHKDIVLSSSLMINSNLKGENRIIDICKNIGATTYINLSGGIDLYNKNNFMNENIDIHFIKMQNLSYPQFGNDFVSDLSIIDVLMFNSTADVKHLLQKYDLL
jgi:hypothetical protein